MQKSPLIAGFALSAMVLGWPVGATIGVRGFRRFGVRAVLRTGARWCRSARSCSSS